MMGYTIQVLLIEDDPMVQEVNREFIASVSGFNVIAQASNGEEGIQKIEQLKPDLVILDVFMPRKDGIKTMQEIRRLQLSCDVIVVSAAKDKDTVGMMLQNGAVDYIIKPFSLKRIQKSLENYRQFKRNLQYAEVMTQDQLDTILNITRTEQLERDLPKGLNQYTFQEITEFMKRQSEPRSAEEVAQALGIARVTARRYLEYLEKRNMVKLDVRYGGVGRPVNRYFFNQL
jgi:two-component system response regulator DctR